MANNNNLAMTLNDLFIKIKNATQRSINVAEVAVIRSIDMEKTIGRYRCELVCSSSLTVDCDALQGLEIGVGQTVLIVFCDNDFRVNLHKIRSSEPIQPFTSTELHSTSYGIIVGSIL